MLLFAETKRILLQRNTQFADNYNT